VTALAAAAAAEREHHRRHALRPPSVAVAVLTRNAPRLIADCCDSLLERVRYRPLGLLVCDTGTDDPATLRYYEHLCRAAPAAGVPVAVVPVGPYHFARNYNRAAAGVRADYLLLQNNDTVARTDHVTALVRLLDVRVTASAGPRMLYPDGRIQHDGQLVYTRPDGTTDGLCGHLHLGLPPAALPATAAGVHAVDGNTAAGCLVRTADFRAVGGFDEGFHDIFQDVDLMVRLAAAGGRHFCDRDAVLTHVDNASRLAARPPAEVAALMRADREYLLRKAAAHGWRRPAVPEPDFSLIVLAGRFDRYARLLDGVAAQTGGHTVELLGLPNYHGTHDCMFRALNQAAGVATGRHLIYCHDDIRVGPGWLTELSARMRELDAAGERWGVIGPAGVATAERESHFFLLDGDGRRWRDPTDQNRTEARCYPVDALDEMCLVAPRAAGLRFSAGPMRGFHFYGIDLCTQARRRGLRCFAVDAPVAHDSDGLTNLEPESRFLEYVRAAMAWDGLAKANGLPAWRSTTARGTGDHVLVYAVPPSLAGKYGAVLQVRV
jgi:GT2 family glycosyltransferase